MPENAPEGPLYRPEELPRRPARDPSSLFGFASLMTDMQFKRFNRINATIMGSVMMRLTALPEAAGDGSLLVPHTFGALHLTPELLDTHIAVIGATGSGKTYRLIAPMYAALLRQTSRSVAIVNTKGPSFSRALVSIARRSRPGCTVQLVNFCDATRSLRWNPLSDPRDRRQSQMFSQSLYAAAARPGPHDSPFWRNSSSELIEGLMEVKRTLPEIYAALRMNPMAFAKWTAQHPNQPGLARFAEFLRSESHNAQTIQQDAAVAIAGCGVLDERVGAIVGGDSEFKTAEFIGGAGDVLIIEMNESEAPLCKPLVTLLINELFDNAIRLADASPSGRLKRPAALLIDEFASAVGQIPSLPVKVNTLRSRGFSIVVATQSVDQITATYGSEALPLLGGFRTLVTIGQLTDTDRELIARKSGMMTVSGVSITRRYCRKTKKWRRSTRTTMPQARPLLLPSDLDVPDHPIFGPLSVIFLPQQRPLLAHLTASWEIPHIEEAITSARGEDPSLDLMRSTPIAVAPPSPAAPAVPAITADVLALAPAAKLSDISGMGSAELALRIEEMERAAKIDEALSSSLAWWRTYKAIRGPVIAFRTLEALATRGATLCDLAQAARSHAVTGMVGALSALDLRIARTAEAEERAAAAAQSARPGDGTTAKTPNAPRPATGDAPRRPAEGSTRRHFACPSCGRLLKGQTNCPACDT